jgi:hypothetical protein
MGVKIGIGPVNQMRRKRPDVIADWAERAGFSALGTVGRFACRVKRGNDNKE